MCVTRRKQESFALSVTRATSCIMLADSTFYCMPVSATTVTVSTSATAVSQHVRRHLLPNNSTANIYRCGAAMHQHSMQQTIQNANHLHRQSNVAAIRWHSHLNNCTNINKKFMLRDRRNCNTIAVLSKIILCKNIICFKRIDQRKVIGGFKGSGGRHLTNKGVPMKLYMTMTSMFDNMMLGKLSCFFARKFVFI